MPIAKQIKVTLSNVAGELGTDIIDIEEGTDPAELSDAIQDVIAEWVLDIGDVIKIEEF